MSSSQEHYVISPTSAQENKQLYPRNLQQTPVEKPKYPSSLRVRHSAFLLNRLQKSQTSFDSGDYQMVQINVGGVPGATKPTPATVATCKRQAEL